MVRTGHLFLTILVYCFCLSALWILHFLYCPLWLYVSWPCNLSTGYFSWILQILESEFQLILLRWRSNECFFNSIFHHSRRRYNLSSTYRSLLKQLEWKCWLVDPQKGDLGKKLFKKCIKILLLLFLNAIARVIFMGILSDPCMLIYIAFFLSQE